MKSRRRYSLLIIIILLSGCRSYEVIKIERKIKPDKNSEYKIQFSDGGDKPSAKKNSDQSSHVYVTERYLTGLNIPGPAGDIIRTGVSEAMKNNFSEAEFLFHQAEALTGDGSPQNNLAVIYEASGRYDAAFEMYGKALHISQDEKKFRTNFHYFLNQDYPESRELEKKRKR